MDSDHLKLRKARFAELDGRTLYDLLQLRVDVFVVEQDCPYRDLDGRDLEEATTFLWMERDGLPLAGLRILAEPDGAWKLSRVVTRADQRGRGLAATLIGEALRVAARPVRLDAQAHLEGWYSGFGFVTVGEEFMEDGIPHVPMRLG